LALLILSEIFIVLLAFVSGLLFFESGQDCHSNLAMFNYESGIHGKFSNDCVTDGDCVVLSRTCVNNSKENMETIAYGKILSQRCSKYKYISDLELRNRILYLFSLWKREHFERSEKEGFEFKILRPSQRLGTPPFQKEE